MFQNFERFFPTRNLQASVSRGVNSNVEIKPRLWLQSSISTRISRHWKKERARIWIWMKIASPNIVDTTRFWPIQFFFSISCKFLSLAFANFHLVSPPPASFKFSRDIKTSFEYRWTSETPKQEIWFWNYLFRQKLAQFDQFKFSRNLLRVGQFVSFCSVSGLIRSGAENIALNHICAAACFTQLN